MDKKKSLYTLKEEEPEIVIYLLLDYYFYQKLEVNFQSKSTKILILLKNNPIPENYRKSFSEILHVETLNHDEIKNILEKFLKNKNREKVNLVASREENFYLAASLRKELKIPGMNLERTQKLINKVKMKNILKSKNIPTHLYILLSKEKIKKNINSYITHLEKEINFPMFIKPTESSGSIGTQKINNKIQLKKILTDITKDNIEYEMDEYVSNTIVSSDVAVINGKIVFFRTRILNNSLHDFSKGIIYSNCIIPPSHHYYKKAFVLVKNIVEAFKGIFGNRCINFDFIEQNQEDLLFLEFNYRRPGAKVCYTFDYQYEEGFNYEVLDMDLAFGAKNVEVFQDDFESDYKFYSGSVLFPGKKGVVKGFAELPENLSSDVKLDLRLKIGDEMGDTVNIRYFPGFLIVRNKSFKTLYREIQRLNCWYPYILE